MKYLCFLFMSYTCSQLFRILFCTQLIFSTDSDGLLLLEAEAAPVLLVLEVVMPLLLLVIELLLLLHHCQEAHIILLGVDVSRKRLEILVVPQTNIIWSAWLVSIVATTANLSSLPADAAGAVAAPPTAIFCCQFCMEKSKEEDTPSVFA